MNAYDQLEQFVETLGEHFDSVLILATVKEEGVTRMKTHRVGNFYASKGAAIEWLEEQQQKDAAYHIASQIKDIPDE